MMIKICTRPINTHPARTSTEASTVSPSAVSSGLRLRGLRPWGSDRIGSDSRRPNCSGQPNRSAEPLSRMSSMRAALNSKYCMRAQISARSLGNGQTNRQANGEFFSYQEGQHRVKRGQHRVISDKEKSNGRSKLRLSEKVKITKTKNGKRWSTSAMEAELSGDILEVRDCLGKIIDSTILKKES